MSMRSRRKENYWGAGRRCLASRLFKRPKVFNETKLRNAIGLNVTRVFGEDLSVALDWFTAPATAFDGARPLDLLTNENISVLRDHLIRLEYCVYM